MRLRVLGLGLNPNGDHVFHILTVSTRFLLAMLAHEGYLTSSMLLVSPKTRLDVVVFIRATSLPYPSCDS